MGMTQSVARICLRPLRLVNDDLHCRPSVSAVNVDPCVAGFRNKCFQYVSVFDLYLSYLLLSELICIDLL